jgi:hypothetical protein
MVKKALHRIYTFTPLLYKIKALRILQAGAKTAQKGGYFVLCLVVDDCPVAAKLVAGVCEAKQIATKCYNDPAQALAHAAMADWRYDFVISDFEMPGMSGLSLAGHFYKNGVPDRIRRLHFRRSSSFGRPFVD